MPRVPPSITCLVKIERVSNTAKFWALGFVPTTTGVPTLKLWWGRIGTVGDEKVLPPFATEAACLAEAEARTAAKLREGYRREEVIDFEPPFMREANRAPTIPVNTGPPQKRRDSDGWLVDGGRPLRPDGKTPTTIQGVSIPQAVERARTVLSARDAVKPLVDKLAVIRKRAEPVKLSHDRVIDFEE